MQYDNSAAPSSDVADFAQELLRNGGAVSENQAHWIATIFLDRNLCLEARLILVRIAREKGADFHPGDLSTEEISRGVDNYTRILQRVSLLVSEPAGRA